jgi:hypothetical protein
MHDENCEVLLAFGTSNSWAGTATREYMLRYLSQLHPEANVFRWLEQRLRETGSETSVQAGHGLSGHSLWRELTIPAEGPREVSWP